MSNKKKSYGVALGGMIAALSVVLILLTALLPVADLVLPAAAGVLLIAAVFELGQGGALLIYVAVGLLSLLLPTDKSAVLYYIFLFGHYPVLKTYLERIPGTALRWVAKLAMFNVCAGVALALAWFLFGVSRQFFAGLPVAAGAALAVVAANLAFAVYDIAVARLAEQYRLRLHKLVSRRR